MTRLFVPVIHGAALDRPDEADTIVAAEAISAALVELGFRSEVVAIAPGLEALDTLSRERPALIFNLVEAIGGIADGAVEVVRRLEAGRHSFTGARANAYAASTSKLATKAVLARAGLPAPRFWLGHEHPPDETEVIVKSVDEHGSLGIDQGSVVAGAGAAGEIADREKRFGGRFFAEAYIDGREFNVSVIETRQGPLVLPIAEIDFSGLPDDRRAIVDFGAKWDTGEIAYHLTPRVFGIEANAPDLAAEISRLTLACWNALDLSGYARVDFRVGADGNPLILEANANPCLAPDAGFAAAASEAGLDYNDVIAAIVDAAMHRIQVHTGHDQDPQNRW